MPKKAWFTLVVLVLISVTLFQGCEKPQDEVYTIGLINPNKGSWGMVEAFVEGMSERGFVEGKNVSYIRVDRRDAIEREALRMVEQRVDMIVTVTTPATRIVRRATAESGTPVVFSMYDPLKARVIDNMRHPGGNLTGVKLGGSTPKALQWLMTVVPDVDHIFVPVSYDTKAAEWSLEALLDTAERFGIKVTVREVTDLRSLLEGLDSVPEGVDAIFMLHSILIASNVDAVYAASLRQKVPIAAGLAKYKAGATVTYSSDYYYIGKQMSRIATKILQGAAPANLPVESVDYFMGINLKSADQIGLNITDDVLKQADYIVQ